MQPSQQLLTQPTRVQSIQGDPAARRIGFFLMIAFGIMIIGAIVGIAAGNIAHYRYFGPQSNASLSGSTLPFPQKS